MLFWPVHRWDEYQKQYLNFCVWKGQIHSPAAYIPSTHFSQRLIRSQGYTVAGSIKSLKNSDDRIWNWTCDLVGCITLPQLASTLLVSTHFHVLYKKMSFFWTSECTFSIVLLHFQVVQPGMPFTTQLSAVKQAPTPNIMTRMYSSLLIYLYFIFLNGQWESIWKQSTVTCSWNTWNTTENLSPGDQCSGQGLKQFPLKYKSEILLLTFHFICIT